MLRDILGRAHEGTSPFVVIILGGKIVYGKFGSVLEVALLCRCGKMEIMLRGRDE